MSSAPLTDEQISMAMVTTRFSLLFQFDNFFFFQDSEQIHAFIYIWLQLNLVHTYIFCFFYFSFVPHFYFQITIFFTCTPWQAHSVYSFRRAAYFLSRRSGFARCTVPSWHLWHVACANVHYSNIVWLANGSGFDPISDVINSDITSCSSARNFPCWFVCNMHPDDRTLFHPWQ